MNRLMLTIFSMSCLCTVLPAQDEIKLDQKTKEKIAFDKLVSSSTGLHIYLSNKYVQRDLELTQEQRRQLSRIELKYNREYVAIESPKNMELGIRKLPNGQTKVIGVRDTPQYKAFEAKRKEVRGRQARALTALLLPHQKKRLLQILAQKRLHRGSAPFGAYTNKELDDLIGGLTSNEKEMLKNTVAENYKKYIAEIVELKRKYELKIRSGLPDEKQKKLEKLFGEPFLWLNTIR